MNVYFDTSAFLKMFVEHAGDLAEQHGLRGYDAVHLATALAAGVDAMVTADADLLRAAPICGLSILDARN